MTAEQTLTQVGPYEFFENKLFFLGTKQLLFEFISDFLRVNKFNSQFLIQVRVGPSAKLIQFRNIYCFNSEGHLLWQIDDPGSGGTNAGPESLSWDNIFGENEILVGQDSYGNCFEINPKSGKKVRFLYYYK